METTPIEALKEKRIALDELEIKIEELLCEFEKEHNAHLILTADTKKRVKLQGLFDWGKLNKSSE